MPIKQTNNNKEGPESSHLEYLANAVSCNPKDYFKGREKVVMNRFYRKFARIIINNQIITTDNEDR